MARPTKFTKAMQVAIGKMTEDGFTVKEIVNYLGIDEQTYYNWKRDNKKFFGSLSDWRDAAAYRVEEALFHSCLGGKVMEVKPVTVKVGDGMEKVEMLPHEKHIPANVSAQKYFLNNRRASDWVEKREFDINEVNKLTDEELRAKALAILGKSEENDGN